MPSLSPAPASVSSEHCTDTHTHPPTHTISARAPNASGQAASIFKCKFLPFHPHPVPAQLLSKQLWAGVGGGGSKNKSHFLLLFSARLASPRHRWGIRAASGSPLSLREGDGQGEPRAEVGEVFRDSAKNNRLHQASPSPTCHGSSCPVSAGDGQTDTGVCTGLCVEG